MEGVGQKLLAWNVGSMSKTQIHGMKTEVKDIFPEPNCKKQ
jgi:hypothetical protein